MDAAIRIGVHGWRAGMRKVARAMPIALIGMAIAPALAQQESAAVLNGESKICAR